MAQEEQKKAAGELDKMTKEGEEKLDEATGENKGILGKAADMVTKGINQIAETIKPAGNNTEEKTQEKADTTSKDAAGTSENVEKNPA